MRRKVGIIGHFGGGQHYCDGQTVKTQELAMLLEQTGQFDIKRVDTYFNKCNKMKLAIDVLLCLFTCKDVFLLVADKGMNFFLPFLYYFSKGKRINVYHYIIGSEILSMVQQNPRLVKYLNSFAVNWFEYESGTCVLKKKGVLNADTLPNMKLITPVDQPEVYPTDEKQYRFCTFSRVIPEKGIPEAIHAIREINAENGKSIARLDIYGPVDAGFESEFMDMVNANRAFVTYKGVAESHQSVMILKNYYAVLFPTRWLGEGMAGTIIDAFAAGVPVIASDWNANGELITNGSNGVIYPSENLKSLKNAVVWAMKNPEKMNQMRTACRESFERYKPEAILTTILSEMQRHG